MRSARTNAHMRKQPAHMLRSPNLAPRLPPLPVFFNLLPEVHFQTDTHHMQNTLIAQSEEEGRWGKEKRKEKKETGVPPPTYRHSYALFLGEK